MSGEAQGQKNGQSNDDLSEHRVFLSGAISVEQAAVRAHLSASG